MPDGLLSMWRGYGGNGNGAAIIFDTSKLNHVNGSPLTIHYVRYASKEERKRTINEKLEEFAKLLSRNHIPDQMLDLAAYMIFNRLKTEAIFTKHHGFKEEREWRALYLREFDFEKKLESMLHYSVGKRGIEPKLKFKVQPIAAQLGIDVTLEQFVHQIILGPSISSPLALMSAKRMLEKVGKPSLATKLSASSTPFRP